MIWGAPGVGKSTAIRELAKKLGIGFIDVRLAQREPVDMRGLPVPDGEQVRWLVSSEWPRDPESKGIIIFDELTAADKTLQVAAYEFILDRRLGDLYKVPKNWYIVAAGNRTEDRAVACSMSSALANRFLHVEVAPQLKDFVAYGESHGMHPVVLDFLRFRPKLLFSQKQENLPVTEGQTLILTPHAGEAARLLACKTADINADRMSAAKRIVERYHAICVLKGHNTIVASPDGRTYICEAGNPFMAMGGMGDLLSGVIAARWSYIKDAFLAACSAVWLHAAASDALVTAEPPDDPSIINTAAKIGSLRVFLERNR